MILTARSTELICPRQGLSEPEFLDELMKGGHESSSRLVTTSVLVSTMMVGASPLLPQILLSTSQNNEIYANGRYIGRRQALARISKRHQK